MGRESQPRNGDSQDAQGLTELEGSTAITDERGEEVAGPGGVSVHGTHEEDDPVTWEALTSP